ncbi:MAG: sugar phosphate nucleotidyltransferase, partial [Burkholderiaceae bacterium]
SGAHHASGADLSLGLFETDNPAKFGMVRLNRHGEITGFVDKPKQTSLKWMWGLAVWSPAFSAFMAEALASMPAGGPEVVLSDIFDLARQQGLKIAGVPLAGSTYNDIGTPEEFQRVVQNLADRNGMPRVPGLVDNRPVVKSPAMAVAGRLSVVQGIR